MNTTMSKPKGVNMMEDMRIQGELVLCEGTTGSTMGPSNGVEPAFMAPLPALANSRSMTCAEASGDRGGGRMNDVA